jgi:nicotinate dehydrogenase subunit B
VSSEARGSIDPTRLENWIRIRPDNKVALWTGVSDFGQSTVSTNFRQIAAEELRLPFAAIAELITGDTNETPDGGIAAGAMHRGSHMVFGGVGLLPESPFGRHALNVQKIAAFAFEELIARAAERLGAPAETLTAADGVIRAAFGASVTYAELVRDSPLSRRIEVIGSAEGYGLGVLGTPKVVPVAEYRVIGTDCPSPRTAQIVTASLPWVTAVRLPGMLHGRMVHPRTLGSTLVSAGTVDADRYPTAQLIVRGNFVGVVAEDEWEAICAAGAVAATTVWSDWRGLPGHDRLIETLLELDWSTMPPGTEPWGHHKEDQGRVPLDDEAIERALDSGTTRVDAFYFVPYYKHSPIGPEISVADVRPDGSVHVWTSSQKPRALQPELAQMLSTEVENVVVHSADGAGSFGRTTSGSAGSESEAVVLSQACRRPVRLQWMREDDLLWTTQQAAYLGQGSAALDENGRLVAFDLRHHSPGYVGDSLQLGGLLAGLPCNYPPEVPRYHNILFTETPYDLVPHLLEQAFGTPVTVGAGGSPTAVGLRHRSMRSPDHLQQNFGVECLMTEAAAAAGADPIQFRIDHSSDARFINALHRVRELSGWQTRPSPAPDARAVGAGVVRGRGVGVTIRQDSYFAGVAEISLDLSSGQITVDKYWLAADCGLIVNPRLLRVNVEGATVMGLSQALHEEVTFNRSAITCNDFRSYPILTMAEMPEIVVELIDGRATMAVGTAAEPPNMVPPVALVAAVFDATGKQVRRLPLRPEYVLTELREQ